MRILYYFRELLETLKKIEKHLALLAETVKVNHHRHGDRVSLSTKHWNS